MLEIPQGGVNREGRFLPFMWDLIIQPSQNGVACFTALAKRNGDC